MRENGKTGIRERTGARSRESGEAEGSRHGNARMNSDRLASEELVQAERANLVAEKQVELANVLDSHDSLVREMFHMDTFVNMIGYDPKEAKKDVTKLFQNYKAEYDLVDKAVSSSSPSRATRRSREEKIQLLKPPSISAPCSPLGGKKPKASNSRLDHTNVEGKSRSTESHNPGIRSVVPEKEQLKNTEDSVSALLIRRDLEKRNGEDTLGHSLPKKRRRVILSHPGESTTMLSRKSSRLKQYMVTPDVAAQSNCTDVENLSDSISALPQTSLSCVEQNIKPGVALGPPSPSKIKRVKLLVRRPPPPITNPKQRPPQARHNYSVNALLSSYFTFDHLDIDESGLAEKIHVNAHLLERTDKLKQQGRFVPDHDVIIDLDSGANEPLRRWKDHWDHVVEAACHLGNHWKKRTPGHEIAGHLAKLVRGYWDGQEARKEKLKVQEERRLRALAKATIKVVADEWKKAVFHIREQERLKREAEEVRRGRAHLDAILNQSGQLLETQQGDLTRGDLSRSRSASLSLSHHEWTTEDDDDNDSEAGKDTDGASTADESLNGHEIDEGDIDLAELPKEETDLDERSSEYDDSESNADALTDLDGDNNTQMLLGSLPFSDSSGQTQDSSHQNPQQTPDTYISGQTQLNESFEHLTEESINDSVDDYSLPSSSVTRSVSTAIVDREPGTLYESPRHTPSQIAAETSLKEDPTLHFGTQSPLGGAVGGAVDDEIMQQNDTSEGCPSIPVTIVPLTYPTPDSPDLGSRSSPESVHLSEGATLDNHPSEAPEGHILPESEANSSSPSSLVPAQVEEDDIKKPISAENLAPSEKADAELSEEPEVLQETAINIPNYLKPYAVAPVDWGPDSKIVPPLLLRGILRPYQQSGLEWLASLHVNNLNGILADEMGLGKTIQTIALLAYLACDRGIWGPHLIVVPTSVLLNWEMEFKKFLPGFRVLSYHGNTKRRKELRQGWNDKHHFNVCITSYTLASRDAHIFKRKAWYYMILDEAHMIKNFKSQRWNILLMFRSFRRLLLTGTPLQNNLTELWALLQFLMSGSNFASLKDFGDWFSNPLEKAIEMGNTQDEDTMQRISKLHTVLRPYLLRRLKSDVEKELPSKYEHLVVCPLSKRQRFLYDEFMARSHTREALQSGVYQKIANVLMQLRKVCNHPDLFEVRPVVTSLAMERSAIADFEIKELLIRRRMLDSADNTINLGLLGLQFIDIQDQPVMTALETRRLDASSLLPFSSETPGEAPPKDYRTISGFKKLSSYMQHAEVIAHWTHIRYLNRLRCANGPIYGSELLNLINRLHKPIIPISCFGDPRPDWESVRVANTMIKSYGTRADEMASLIDKFAFATPAAVTLDLPRLTFPGRETVLTSQPAAFDSVLHRASVKLQIAFPDPSLLQYDCGKLQELNSLLREKKAGGHRVLMFTQMTKILDILEIFLNYHGYLYLRLDGATKIEDRQYITERFNADPRIFCFIASSRSGGVGINLTGADTVVFYDSDFNPQMDRQCEDRAHRIGQIRDVHIYRFVSQHTIEEALLRKANQKRFLDDLVIQKGEFDWRSLFNDESALSKALEEFEDTEDAHAAAVAATEEVAMQGADEADFGGDLGESVTALGTDITPGGLTSTIGDDTQDNEPQAEDEGASVVEFMIKFVQQDWEFFKEWRL